MSTQDEVADYTPTVAIVTGAAQGIGRGIALRLAQDGFKVTVNDIPAKEKELEDLAQVIKDGDGDSLVVTGDVSKEEDVERLVAETVAKLGSVDVMVANAGIARGGKFLETEISKFDETIAVNLRGVMLCYQIAARQMVKQKRGGRLIGASSTFGKRGVSYSQAYCAAKFAVRGLSQSVAREMMPYKITCNSYAPGLIYTDLTKYPEDRLYGGSHGNFVTSLLGMPNGPGATPEVVASIVSYLCKPEAYFITGESVSVCGGLVME